MRKLAIAILLTLATGFPENLACAFAGESVSCKSHAEITHDALAGQFNPPNLELIQRSCDSQIKPGSEGASESRRHFTDDNFSKAIAYMDRQKKLILDFSCGADTNVRDRARALYHLGLLVHTAQDFYSHTNYIEVTAEYMKQRNQGLIGDPYSMDLVDWSKLGTHRTNVLQSTPELYKDDANGPEGRIALGDSTYFKVAKELATKETMRQWNSVEALIKLRYGTRSSAILTAMKQASCPVIDDLDKLSENDVD